MNRHTGTPQIEFLATAPISPCRDEEDRKQMGIDTRLHLAGHIMAAIMGRAYGMATTQPSMAIQVDRVAVLACDAADALIAEWADRSGLL